MREHYTAVVELLSADPLSSKAAALRAEIESMEHAERRPEGVMLT